MSNYSGEAVVILGYEGEPYLRFAKHGVYVNARSPARYLNRFRFPPPLRPGKADATAQPAWRRVRRGVTFEWHDHRIHWTAQEPPPAVQEDPDESHLIRRWRVPGRVDGNAFALAGFLGYVPPRRASANESRGWVVPSLIGAGALALASVGAGARRRKRRAH